MKVVHATLADKLEAYSIRLPEVGCWLWSIALNQKGYGIGTHNGKRFIAHRASYEVFVGPVGHWHVLQRCDVRSCINPHHRYLGTEADNGRDKALRKRAASKSGELNGRAKLTLASVREIRALKGVKGLHKVARHYGVSLSCIERIWRGHAWSFDV